MVDIADRVPVMTEAARARLDRAMTARKAGTVDMAEQIAIRDALLALA
jgi:beta-N-acetylhexosaminidase